MDPMNRAGHSPTQLDYYAIGKVGLTSVALMALSIGAMKGIERYTKRTFTPFQRNVAGVVLTTVYMVAATRFFGPLTKKNDFPPSYPDSRGPSTTVANPDSRPDSKVGEPPVEARDRMDHVIDLPPRSDFQKGSEFVSPGLQVEERGLRADQDLHGSLDRSVIHPSLSPLEQPQSQEARREHHALSLALDFNELGAGALRVVNESHYPQHIEVRRRQSRLLGPRNPIDLTHVDPRQIQFALEGFKDAILRNGVRFVECNFPLQGRMIAVCVDVSTEEKQLKALRTCDLLRVFVMGGRREAFRFIEPKRPLGIVELPDFGRIGGQRMQFQVNAGRPAVAMEDEDLVLVENPARPDEGMLVTAANYNVEVHGVNGYRMKQKLYTSLFAEYAYLLKEKLIVDPMIKLQQIEDVSYCWRSHEDHLLMYVLHYLLREGSQGYHLMVSGEEARYWDFIHAHQALMNDYQGKEDTYSHEVLRWSRAIAEVRMTPRIQAYQESLVGAHYEGSHPAMTAKTFHQAFAMRNEALRSADSRMKLWSVWSETSKLQGATSYCNYFGMNPPNLRKVETWTDGAQRREIFYLRHSTPHAGASLSKAPIDLTYREFLRYSHEKGQGVLYGAHQRLGDFGVKFEQEGYRCQSIVDLEKDHPNLILLFQSVENDLFKKGATTFTALKAAIIDSFKQKEGARRNRLPHFLVTADQEEGLAIKPAYEDELRRILDFIHLTFFPREGDAINQENVDYYGGLTDSAHLTTESQAFIMLFFHFQREHLKHADLSQYGYNFAVTFVNTGCKDDYDRGLGQNLTTDRVHHHQVHGSDIPEADLEASLSSGQAPPIQGKGVPVIKYRVHPALLVSSMLANLKPEQLHALQNKKWNGWSLESYHIERRVGQTAV